MLQLRLQSPLLASMSKIAIYWDAGVSPGAFQQLLTALSEPFLAHYSFETVDRRFFLSPSWEERTSLLIFPGGRDLPYHQALQGEANGRIRSFVERGGRFLGICAGGYYGASTILFESGQESEIRGERELAFFPGRAIGPAFGKEDFRYQSEAGARGVTIEWEGGASSAYFNGGCFFEKAEAFPPTQIVAHYRDLPGKPAAAVYCKSGSGAALLSGIHPEYAPKDPFWPYFINKILT